MAIARPEAASIARRGDDRGRPRYSPVAHQAPPMRVAEVSETEPKGAWPRLIVALMLSTPGGSGCQRLLVGRRPAAGDPIGLRGQPRRCLARLCRDDGRLFRRDPDDVEARRPHRHHASPPRRDASARPRLFRCRLNTGPAGFHVSAGSPRRRRQRRGLHAACRRCFALVHATPRHGDLDLPAISVTPRFERPALQASEQPRWRRRSSGAHVLRQFREVSHDEVVCRIGHRIGWAG